MTRLSLRGVVARRLGILELEFEAGISTVLMGSLRESVELAELAAGVARAKHGHVRIDERDPFRDPDIRRRVASLFDAEEPVGGDTVEIGLGRALDLRGSTKSAHDVLIAAGCDALCRRRPSSLSPDENRSVALSLALSLDRPLVAALVEPFVSGVDRRFVVSTVSEWARRGTVVLSVVASMRDAEELGGGIFSLARDRSSIVRLVPAPSPRVALLELVVRVDDPRRLASALAGDDAVASVRWDTVRDSSELVVRGPDVERASLAVLRAAHECGVRVATLVGRALTVETGRSPLEAQVGTEP